MKEIGGYLELENLSNNEYYSNAIGLNTARNALVYLVKAKIISKIYLPYYLCDSICNVCIRENIPHEFYHVNKDFLPLFDKALGSSEYLYIVNYYGQLTEEQLKAYKKQYKNIIVDNVQAFFTPAVDSIDTIYSCRKFFGVPDGAYLITDKADLLLETDVSFDRTRHILGRYDCKNAADYYDDFKKNEMLFDDLPLMYMSRFTHNIMGTIDYASVIEKREQNWQSLHTILKDKNLLTLHMPKAPYMYPFYISDGDNIRRMLAKQKIYIPTLWPNVLTSNGNKLEKDFARNILPLPIDQRYTAEDMQRLTDALLSFLDR